MSCTCTLMTQLSLGQIPYLIIRSDGKATHAWHCLIYKTGLAVPESYLEAGLDIGECLNVQSSWVLVPAKLVDLLQAAHTMSGSASEV